MILLLIGGIQGRKVAGDPSPAPTAGTSAGVHQEREQLPVKEVIKRAGDLPDVPGARHLEEKTVRDLLPLRGKPASNAAHLTTFNLVALSTLEREPTPDVLMTDSIILRVSVGTPRAEEGRDPRELLQVEQEQEAGDL